MNPRSTLQSRLESSEGSPYGRLRAFEKFSYACGAVPFMFANLLVLNLIYPVFNITLGLSGTVVGIVLAVGRLWDAFTDPFMGSLSDNSRHPSGRRRPFILAGGLALAVTLPLVWMVPAGWSDLWIVVWLVCTILLLYTACTVFGIPWMSLSYEISRDPLERTRVAAWVSYVGSFAVLSIPWVYRLAQSEVFDNTMQGVRVITWIVGALIVLFTLITFFGCRERLQSEAAQQPKLRLLEAIWVTLRNRPFLIFVCGCVTMLICLPMMVSAFGLYINSYYIFQGDTVRGAEFVAMGVFVGVGIKFAIIPFCVRLSGRFGRINVMRGALWLSVIGSLSTWFLYTPVNAYLQFLSLLFIAPANTAFWMLAGPAKADCVDFDEWTTGLRREGMYAAVSNWIEKLSFAICLILAGVILDWSGFQASLGAEQPEGAMTILRLSFAGLNCSAALAALVALQFYPLTDRRMAAIRRDLVRRRKS